HAHARAAGAHRDRPLGLQHLVVDAPDDRRHLDRHAAGHDQQVRLARRGAQGLEAEARDVHALIDDRHHLHRAAGEAEGGGHEGVPAGPVGDLVERRREDALLDELVELRAFELALEHLTRVELAGAEVALRAVAEQLTLHFHSSAPLRQTYTNATIRSAMNTIVSHSANVPKALSWIATGNRKMVSMSKRMKSIATR